jgi:peptide deformylase
MALREIQTWPSEVLKERALPVDDFGEGLQELVDDMVETMYDAPGIGLAGPQVGASQRLIVIDLSSGTEEDELLVLVNPEIISAKGEVEAEEGCLSLPGLTLKMCRSEKVVARGQNRHGEDVEVAADGLLARALQHEIDHLNGLLIIDRLHPIRRELLKKKLKKALASPQ